MALIKYLYIDDMFKEAEDIAAALSTEDLEIIVGKPTFNDALHEKIISEQFDGLILDQRLSDNPEFGIDTRGTSIAQYLRSVSSEEKTDLNSFPIVLFSASKYKRDFINETTGLDLFDCVYFKEDDNNNLIKELSSLARGYNLLSSTIKLNEVLKIEIHDLDQIDYRLIDELNSRLNKDQSKHKFALFYLNQVLKRNGVLIDEYVFAARLGIDIENSGENWLKLKDSLKEIKYQGIFHEAWERWWMYKLERWWENEICSESLLSELTATERVTIINKKLNIEILPAQKTEKSSSEEFWTVCIATKRPIDILDGIRIKQDQPKPWQDEAYISIDELISEKHQDLWIAIHASDKDRAKEIKERNVSKR